MISFARPYSFRHVLGQGVTPVANPPASSLPAIPAAPPKESSFGSVKMGGYDVPLLALTVATAAIVGAIWVTTQSIQAIDRA